MNAPSPNPQAMSPTAQFLFGKVFGWIMILAGAVALYFGVVSLQRAKESVSWPTVQGVIEESRVERDRSDARKDATYLQKICYSFEVEGAKHSGTRVAYGDYSSSDLSHAQGIVDRYPVGKQVSVYYQPGKPDECLLEPGVTAQAWFMPGFGLTLLVGGVLWAAFMPRVAARQGQAAPPDAAA